MNTALSAVIDSLPFAGNFALKRILALSPKIVAELNEKESSELATFTNDERRREFVTSRLLLKQLADEWDLDTANFVVAKNELGNPFAEVGDDRYEISIAHTKEEVFCGLTRTEPIGVDLEPMNRDVSGRLRTRILHPTEKEEELEVSTIQLWTIKEAYIKLRGEGLRLNMNDVYVQSQQDHFLVKLDDDKKAKICSFSYQDNWLSIAFYL
ncbi:4'-phosphopantetheinyl transferase family protein [Fodinibius salsisoli]|uniref:4'-phosphopantetheinyl transferase superfamily protein n=1 Tax=Fodinibius salsisoli TaxID=2820877 RepID=A0ABT3PKH9_9BACT|nr:4'-phosphopantetheinyl transferase superfamily protein [Fodinibius salsisoli]MCW9706407.1 4'-phosphopantetheinyl transferase superfamily protein [Fodinibius salsisoli]